jgi:ribokinase
MHPSTLSRRYDLLTFGDMCVDLIVSGGDIIPQFGQVEKLVGDYTLELGGSCCIFACQAAKLGLRTAILGRMGPDSFGELIRSRLEECGVDTRYVIVDPSLKTGLGIALCKENDRAILTYLGSINALLPEDVTDELLGSTRHLHHGSFYLQTNLRPSIPEIFRRAHSLDVTTSLDTNWDPEERWDGGLHNVLPLTDIFLPNDHEALHISRRATVEQAGKTFLDLGVKLAVIKAGKEGALVFARDLELERRVVPVAGGDSIGAGDSFDAGFLAGWLRGLSLERSLEIACACGRSVAGKTGGLAGQLSWSALVE